VAGESALPYVVKDEKTGKKKVIFRAKKWEHLKLNIGRTVPIIDGHPDENNGFEGLFSGKEKTYGKGTIKQCPTGEKRLCMDMVLADGTPIRKGYSIGYPYAKIEEEGDIDGQHYDEVQGYLLIDHAALTDGPRYNRALQVAGDKRLLVSGDEITYDNGDSRAAIKINAVGYDSLVFKHDARIDDIIKIVKEDNPDIPESELHARAFVMLANEKELKQVEKQMTGTKSKEKERMDDEEEEEEEKMSSGDAHGLSKTELVERIARLEAERDTMRVSQKKIRSLESKLTSATDEKEKYKKKYEAELTRVVETNIDTLVKKHGYDVTDFKGKSADFIAGTLFGVTSVSKGVDSGKKIKKQEKGQDEEEPSVNDYVYDHNKGSMVLRSELYGGK
jgi:hypothetical protein